MSDEELDAFISAKRAGARIESADGPPISCREIRRTVLPGGYAEVIEVVESVRIRWVRTR